MAPRETNRSRDGFHDSILRIFALIAGIVILLLASAILAAGLFLQGAGPAFPLESGETIGSFVALAGGAFLVYWGARRPASRKKLSEKTLSGLVQQYEREGKTKELEDARERLIELLIEKDEQNSRERKQK